MPPASIPDLLLAALVFAIAGATKGLLGMGLPTVAMGLLGLFMPVAQAAVLIGVPSLATNAWQAWDGPHRRRLLRLLWPLLAGVAAGVWSGAGFLAPAHARTASLALGLCLAAYGLTGLAGLRLPAPPQRGRAVIGAMAGWLTGLVTAATGVFVLPAVPYLQALALDKDQMTQALGLSFLVSTLALAVLLAASGQMQPAGLQDSVLMLAPALAGLWFGQRLRGRLDEAAFRRLFFGGLLALGAWIVARQVLAE